MRCSRCLRLWPHVIATVHQRHHSHGSHSWVALWLPAIARFACKEANPRMEHPRLAPLPAQTITTRYCMPDVRSMATPCQDCYKTTKWVCVGACPYTVLNAWLSSAPSPSKGCGRLLEAPKTHSVLGRSDGTTPSSEGRDVAPDAGGGWIRVAENYICYAEERFG